MAERWIVRGGFVHWLVGFRKSLREAPEQYGPRGRISRVRAEVEKFYGPRTGVE
jgi:hypothetical protein